MPIKGEVERRRNFVNILRFASQGVARWWETDYHAVGMLPTGVT